MLAEDGVVVELKAVKTLDTVHAAQCINFGPYLLIPGPAPRQEAVLRRTDRPQEND